MKKQPISGFNEKLRSLIVLVLFLSLIIVSLKLLVWIGKYGEIRRTEQNALDARRYKLAAFTIKENTVIAPGKTWGIFILGIAYGSSTKDVATEVTEYVFYKESSAGGYILTRVAWDRLEIVEDEKDNPYVVIVRADYNYNVKIYQVHIPPNSIQKIYDPININDL